MNNIPLESGSSLLSGSSPTAVKAKSSSEMLSSHLMSMHRKARQNERGKRERKRMKKGCNRLWEFYSIICSLHAVALSHISIMCLFWLAALSLVQTLVAEDVNGQEFNFALE